jgi:hypothetical protein
VHSTVELRSTKFTEAARILMHFLQKTLCINFDKNTFLATFWVTFSHTHLGCQMVYFHTKMPIMEGLGMKKFGYFMTIWFLVFLLTFVIFMAILIYLCHFGWLCHDKIWQPWSHWLERAACLKDGAHITFLTVENRVARWHIFKPKIQIWVNFGESYNGRC